MASNEVDKKIKLRAIDGVTTPVDRMAMAFPKLAKSISVANKQFDRMEQGTKGFNKTAARIGGSLKNIGTGLTVGVTAPVSAMGIASVKTFADFDNSMRGVKTLLDETSFGATGLKNGFEKMQKDTSELIKKMPVDMNLVTKALFDTVSAGVDAAEAVKFVGISSKLAVAGLTDVSIATDGMTSAMNAFGFKADQAETIASKFFTAQKFGKTTIEELSKDLGKVASLASSAGVSFDEVLASVSAATLGGIRTNEAYTSMKAVFSNVIKPTKDAKMAADALGVQFDSSALKAKGFTKFMDDIVKASNKLGIGPAKAFEKLFGSTEALNFALTVSGTQMDSYNKTLDALKNSTESVSVFNNAFKEQNASISNQMKILTNNAAALGIKIGQVLAPAVGWLADKIMRVVSFMDTMNPTVLKLVVGAGILAAAMGPVLLVMGGMISALPMIISGLSALPIVFGLIQTSLIPTILLLGKFLLIAGLIATSAYMVMDKWKPIKEFFIDLFTKPLDTIMEMVKWVGKLSGISSLFGLGDNTDKELKKQGFNIKEIGEPVGSATGSKDLTKKSFDFKERQANANVNVKFSNMPKDTKVISEDKESILNISTGLMGAI